MALAYYNIIIMTYFIDDGIKKNKIYDFLFSFILEKMPKTCDLKKKQEIISK